MTKQTKNRATRRNRTGEQLSKLGRATSRLLSIGQAARQFDRKLIGIRNTEATDLTRCQILAIVRARNSKVWLNFRLVCVCRCSHAWWLHAFFIRQGIFCDVTALEFRKCPRDYSYTSRCRRFETNDAIIPSFNRESKQWTFDKLLVERTTRATVPPFDEFYVKIEIDFGFQPRDAILNKHPRVGLTRMIRRSRNPRFRL